MKVFLKELLVERIDSEKRVIIYRSEEDVKDKIKQMMENIEKEGLEVVDGVGEATVIGLTENINQDVEQIIHFLEKKCHINRLVNTKLTAEITLKRIN
jgi:hypothetical protein